jgi:hypothetical protein
MPKKAVLLGIACLILAAAPLAAQSKGDLEKAAQSTLEPLIKILTQWIFPAVALAAALYGVARGIKRGEWDFAVICLLASIALAILPGVLQQLFHK